jgi:hypothetical protein
MSTPRFQVTEEITRNLLKVVDVGLVRGLGTSVPGAMCVEAAVCYALGEDHSDTPTCVAPWVRNIKITLNDCLWPSDKARARGLRRVAVAQLGSKGKVSELKFVRTLRLIILQEFLPKLLKTLKMSCGLSKEGVEFIKTLQWRLGDGSDYRNLRRIVVSLSRMAYHQFLPLRVSDAIENFDCLVSAKVGWDISCQANDFFNNLIAFPNTKNRMAETDRQITARLRHGARMIEVALWECGSPGCEYLYLCGR